MWRRTAQSLGGVVLALIALWIVFTVSMRRNFRPVQDAIRRMNRAVFNPRTMATAGQQGAYASVIQHVGRTTGTPYETPVQAVATDDGFVIALPYGTSADWFQNVLAARSAIIVNDGNTYRVDHPELVPAAVANPSFPPKDQLGHRLYGVDDFLLVRRAESE